MPFLCFNRCIPCLVVSNNMPKSFTLIEALVTVGILTILASLIIPVFYFFQKESDLNNSVQEIINMLRLAQNKTLASEGASQWGIYFFSNQYVLFKGNNFASREISFDEISRLPESVEIYLTDLNGGSSEAVFDRILGTTNQFGMVDLRLKNDAAKTAAVYIENSGRIGLAALPPPSDENRIKDSRHVHLDYSRTIATSSENLILNFEGGAKETIIIADNMKDGQIFWEGELKIHTYRLNDPILGTQFSIHRDRRYNNKALQIEVSGDSSGYLVGYSADGLTTLKTSIYAANLQWQ